MRRAPLHVLKRVETPLSTSFFFPVKRFIKYNCSSLKDFHYYTLLCDFESTKGKSVGYIRSQANQVLPAQDDLWYEALAEWSLTATIRMCRMI